MIFLHLKNHLIRWQILDISLYVLGHFISSGTRYGDQKKYGDHDRIEVSYMPLKVEERIREECQRRKGRGKMVVLSK